MGLTFQAVRFGRRLARAFDADRAVRCARERLQVADDRVVVWSGSAAAEELRVEQTGERGLLPVLIRSPDDDRPVLGPGERHVCEPQALRESLVSRVGESFGLVVLRAHVEDEFVASSGIVVAQALHFPWEEPRTPPKRREHDDRVFEPLAPMHRRELYGAFVALQANLLRLCRHAVAGLVIVADVGEPRQEPGDAPMTRGGLPVTEFRQMKEVRQLALAPDGSEDPRRDVALAHESTERDEKAALAPCSMPACEIAEPGFPAVLVVAETEQLGRIQAEQGRRERQSYGGGVGRLREALEDESQLTGLGRIEDARITVQHARDSEGPQRGLHVVGLHVGPSQHGEVPRSERAGPAGLLRIVQTRVRGFRE